MTVKLAQRFQLELAETKLIKTISGNRSLTELTGIDQIIDMQSEGFLPTKIVIIQIQPLVVNCQ